jgi:hypothetical protein
VIGVFLLRRPRLFILECIPKSDSYEEGEVLYRFLTMTDPKDIALKDFTAKKGFLGYLRRRENLDGFNFIHLSGHGDRDECAFELPRGIVRPDEFPRSCFEGKRVTLSACGLSRDDFMTPFLEVTGAKAAIAPKKDVRFDDASIWFMTFYYLMLHHRFTPAGAFNRANEMLCSGPRRGRVKGGFEYWYP